MHFHLKKSHKILIAAFVTILIAVIAAVIVYVVLMDKDTIAGPSGRKANGAVVTNGHKCAEIGTTILNRGGSAVDAAIAALFCEGVSMPQSMGLGGGFLMTVYRKSKGTAESLNARETAPLGATQDMFKRNASLATRGGLSVAVPGELKGYKAAHERYGVLPWKDLIQPTIDLCNEGILVTEYLDNLLKGQKKLLQADPGLRSVFIDPATNEPYKLNQKIRRPKLAQTLKIIAESGSDALYNGALTQKFVQDIQAKNGIITEQDMHNYTVKWQEPIQISLSQKETMYTTPLPGSGAVLGFIMNLLSDFLDTKSPHVFTNYQKIIESFKFAYGRRTELGDDGFVPGVDALQQNLTSKAYADIIRQQIQLNSTSQDPKYYGANTTLPEDHGTAHISVLAPNGDAVAVTSTINLYFGAGFMSESTGIILNDEMDDFSSPFVTNNFGVPPSEANYIQPGKRPLSSMCPSIIVDQNRDVRLIIGAAGGTKITTSVALITVKNLWFGVPIEEAVEDKRLHHQLFPMEVQLEEPYGKDKEFLTNLRRIGHNYTISPATGFSAVTAISNVSSEIRGANDPRRPGEKHFVYPK